MAQCVCLLPCQQLAYTLTVDPVDSKMSAFFVAKQGTTDQEFIFTRWIGILKQYIILLRAINACINWIPFRRQKSNSLTFLTTHGHWKHSKFTVGRRVVTR